MAGLRNTSNPSVMIAAGLLGRRPGLEDLHRKVEVGQHVIQGMHHPGDDQIRRLEHPPGSSGQQPCGDAVGCRQQNQTAGHGLGHRRWLRDVILGSARGR